MTDVDAPPVFSSKDALDKQLTSANLKILPHDCPQRDLLEQMDLLYDICLKSTSDLHKEALVIQEKLAEWRKLEARVIDLAAASKDQIQLEFRSRTFTTCKNTLMQTPWFEAQVSRWEPDRETGTFFIDRNPRFLEFILDYLRTGEWNDAKIDRRFLPELEDDLDYFGIDRPSPPRLCSWDVSSASEYIRFTENNSVAENVSRFSSWNAARATHLATYAKFTLLSSPSATVFVGLVLGTDALNTSGFGYLDNGYFLELSTGGVSGPNLGGYNVGLPLVGVNQTIEFEVFPDNGRIYITIAGRHRALAFEGVEAGPFYPAAVFLSPSSIRIDEIRA